MHTRNNRGNIDKRQLNLNETIKNYKKNYHLVHLCCSQPWLNRHKDGVLLNDKSLLRLNRHIWDRNQSQSQHLITESAFNISNSIREWGGESPFQWQGNPSPWRGLGSPLFGCYSPETQTLFDIFNTTQIYVGKGHPEKPSVKKANVNLIFFELSKLCEFVYLVEIWHQHAVCLGFVLAKNLFHLRHCQYY